MKKGISLFILMMLLLTTTQSFAQIQFGVRAGLNISTAKVELPSSVTKKMLASFHVGGMVAYNFSETFALEPGLLLSGGGVKFEETYLGTKYTYSYSPFYLEIPVNAVYKVNLGSVKLDLFAGPFLGIGIAGKYKDENGSVDIKFGTSSDSDMKRGNFGLNFGAGVEINNILIRAQYGLGLSNLDPQGSSDNELKSRVIGISVGYMFGEKSK